METVFPEETGLEGMFFAGYKKHNGSDVLTGTVVVKRGYRIDPATGVLIPGKDLYPIFVKDNPYNLLINGSFEHPETGPPENWKAEGITIQTDKTADDPPVYFIHVRGPAGGGEIIQTIECDESLGGRTFVFSFWVRSANPAAHITDIHLESGGSHICSMSINPQVSFQRYVSQGVWPASLEEKKMDVVLMTADSSSIAVDYAGVQLEEGTVVTRWNPESVMRYEHDLASYKEDSDIIIHGFSEKTGNHVVKVNGEAWFSLTLPGTDPDNPFSTMSTARPKSILGWEHRLTDPRKSEAGDCIVWANDPSEPPLPSDFQNIYNNGYNRAARANTSKNKYLPPGAEIRLERPLESPYIIFIPRESYIGSYFIAQPPEPDDKDHWIRKTFQLRADTLVMEPEKSTCYIVWRGYWPFKDHPEDIYRLMEVKKT